MKNHEEKARILSIDYGEKRIGLAISDALGITAQPLHTVKNDGKKKSAIAVAMIIEEHNVQKVIIGLPIKLDGRKGTIYERVKKFGRSLEAESGLIPEYVDEQFTTSSAKEVMLKANLSKEKRKQVVDTMAAQIILQQYLENGGK